MAKAVDARARMHGQPDAEDRKKDKEKKRKTDAKVLVTGKEKASSRRQGKPEDLPIYCLVYRSTKHNFVHCLVYKKQKQEEE
jgi:hypothetical protein